MSNAEPPGLASRRIAAEILEGVLRRRRPLDELLDGPAAHHGLKTLSDRDRALMRRLVATVLRRRGTLQAIFARLLDRGIPADTPRTESALLIGAVQILWLDVPDHAAVDLAVRLVQADRKAARHAGLINAVLRRITRDGKSMLEDMTDDGLDLPGWLSSRWKSNYGAETARSMARAIAVEPPLDLTVKSRADHWALRLHGFVLPTGTVRTLLHGPVAMLPGFVEGEWWVQDAAAALPARLFGDVTGRSIADLCAAPGGKTAQLAEAGARVVGVDRAPSRLARLKENLTRLQLGADTVLADASEWEAGPFDGVLVDTPCSATGTIRRHPDIAWLKQEGDIGALASLQTRLLDRAASLLKPGGTLVYCSCSLEPEEGEQAVAALLDRNPELKRHPIGADEVGGQAEFINPAGELRTLPCYLPHDDARFAGLDGFFAARLVRT